MISSLNNASYDRSRNAASTVSRYGTTDVAAPRRVLLFSGSYNHIRDGVTLTLNRLVTYLESQGTEVLVVAPTTKHPAIDHAGTLDPAPSIPFPGRGEYRVATFIPLDLRMRIVRFRPDIIHVATPDLIGRWAMAYARRARIPVVSTYHTDFTAYLRYYHLGLLEPTLLAYTRYFYSRCDIVCVPTQSMIEELRDRDVTGRMRVWGRGVETDRFNPGKRSMTWRREIGVGDGVPIITFVSRLVWEKNLHLLVEVSNGLRARGVHHRMLIVGDGPAREGLQEQLPDAIFTGNLTGEELSRAYASSDVFLFPSTTETFGNVILEAMASGLPAVCTDATGSRDLVVDRESGYLVPATAIDDLTARVADLVNDLRLRERMGSAALERAREFRWSAILKRMLEYYDEAAHIAATRNGGRSIFRTRGSSGESSSVDRPV